jgi:hypothetical protein
MESLIARKIDFKINLGFYWMELKFWGPNQGLNCIVIEV